MGQSQSKQEIPIYKELDPDLFPCTSGTFIKVINDDNHRQESSTK